MKKGLLTKNEVRNLSSSSGTNAKICPANTNTNSHAIYGSDSNSYGDATKQAICSAESNSLGDSSSSTNGTSCSSRNSCDSNSYSDSSTNTNVR